MMLKIIELHEDYISIKGETEKCFALFIFENNTNCREYLYVL